MPNKKVRNKRGKPISEKRLRNIAADYGWAYSVLEDNPQLFRVFEKAVNNSWSPQRFVAEVQDTNWFKKHSDTWRQAAYLEKTDPKTWGQRVNQTQRQLSDAAGSLGIEVHPKQMREWAEQSLRFGWDQSKINNMLARQVKITGKHTVGGSLADTQNRLESFAFANGVAVSKPTMQKWLRQVVRGTSTVEELEQYVTKQAAARFPNWRKEIEAGMTVAEIAEPYRQTVAELLELNPAQVGINMGLVKRGLSRKNQQGEFESMSLTEFEDEVRKDRRWQYTESAKEQMTAYAVEMGKAFGVLS